MALHESGGITLDYKVLRDTGEATVSPTHLTLNNKMTFIFTIILTIVLNFFITYFGKDVLPRKLSIFRYIYSIDKQIVDSLGKEIAIGIRISIVLGFIIVILVNFFAFLQIIAGVAVGTVLTSKFYSTDWANRIAIYIKRLFK